VLEKARATEPPSVLTIPQRAKPASPSICQSRVVSKLDEAVDVALTDDERFLLERGLVEWGGPARCTEAMAVAIGFDSVADLLATGYRIADDLMKGRPLTRRDWTRALLATEVVFASDVLGSGHDWEATTGLDDASTIAVLRNVQLRLADVMLRP
jgi:hypothetical protein